MDDVAARRREARRKRILENSASRLQKITGRPVEPENDIYAKFNEDILQPEVSNTEFDIGRDFLKDIEAIVQKKQNDVFQAGPSSQFDFKIPELQNRSKNDYELNLNEKLPQNDQKLPSELEHIEDVWIFSFLTGYKSSILLAIVVNILFLLSDSIVQTGILIPFVAMILARYGAGIKTQTSPENNLLVAALILCNIRPQVVYTLRRILLFCNSIAKQFALYVVCFVLIQWVTFYVNNNKNIKFQ